MPELCLDKVRDYTFHKHHVLPGSQTNSISDVARNLVGLHSARLPTPYVALYTRLAEFATSDLQRELNVSRKLIKLRCMRKTLHTVPLDIAPVVHQVTLKMRLADCLTFYRRNDVSEITVGELKRTITNLVKQEPLTSKAILEKMAKFNFLMKGMNKGGFWKRLLRVAIKHLWEDGTLCYINTSRHWGSEKRFYGYTRSVFPELNLKSIALHQAEIKLIHYYISHYGPVTLNDISWWSGLNKRTIKRCVSELYDQLIVVGIQGFDLDFFMTKSDFINFESFSAIHRSWHAILAYEDPSLKGYFESRNRYIKSTHYKELFNPIGEARASILVNGEVVGIWYWDKSTCRIQWRFFDTDKHRMSSAIQESVVDLEDFLNNSKGLLQKSDWREGDSL